MTPRSRLPWFRFFPQDFMGDGKVQMMTATERGIYISLLCHEWSEGSLPDDPDRLSRVCGASPQVMAEAWSQIRACFEKTRDGRLVQARLEEERKRSLDRRRDARKAARARWEDADADAGADATALRSHSDGTAGSNASQSQNQKKKNKTSERWVEEEAWPVFLEELGGRGRQPSLTEKRQAKLAALFDEQLVHEEDPTEVFRLILRAVQASSHHMAERAYQLPESLFRNEDRRETWTLKALENGGGVSGDSRLATRDELPAVYGGES